MTYAGTRVLYASDSRIVELPGFLRQYADRALQDELPMVDFGRSIVSDEGVAIIIGNERNHCAEHKQALVALVNG